MSEESLVDKFYMIVDGYYSESDYFKDVEDALIKMDKINAAVADNSLAEDGMEMIESVIKEMKTEENDADQ